MAKNRTHVVRQPKTKSNRIGVITTDQQRTMRRAASRESEIASGIKVGSGSGYHGGNKKQTNKRLRKEGKMVKQED